MSIQNCFKFPPNTGIYKTCLLAQKTVFCLYAFGSVMEGRSYSSGVKYKFGFNGKELDNEGTGMGGGGSTYDYGFRIYNAQLGRFLSVDPMSDTYPYYSTYQFAGNMPILAVDIDGLEPSTEVNKNEKKINTVKTVVIRPPLSGKQKAKAFFKSFAISAIFTGVIIASVAAIGSPIVAVAALAYGAYQIGKSGYELISGKEAWTGRELSEKEKWSIGGGLAGGLIMGSIGAKVAKGRIFSGKGNSKTKAIEQSTKVEETIKVNKGKNESINEGKESNNSSGKSQFDLPEELQYTNKQIGDKWGDHFKEYPNLTVKDYLALAKEIYSSKTSVWSRAENGEIHVRNGNNLLRLNKDGSFKSLYDTSIPSRKSKK